MNNNEYQQPRREVNSQASGLSAFMSRVFGYMGVAVLVSAIVAVLAGVVFANQYFGFLAANRWFMWVLIIAELGLVMGSNFQANRNPTAGLVMLMGFAAVNGLMLSTIFIQYASATIFSAFFASAAIFGGMSFYGATTHRDLSRIGTQMGFALFGVIIVSLINLFLRSSIISFVFSFIIVGIFVVLTAWDTQRMRRVYEQYGNQVSLGGLAIQGALQLYLDFINIFINILQIFGYGGNRN
ncbi:Bax inhibitor-1/YccA family protein [Furfurilactobacillus siliginis]|uniref:Membrane protein n=1 Tax=Furfurilactobacillus siliginis TaxID=348151 RepID=A0A0R2L411_9LACO|nr:Bax inhibitor-1/YccA family protein [Furfurilactobacillus siliginis]KRN94518.1 integral membrane protein [Furfurilactobacillus siliginis]GEK28559.1 membrane protein [Furfurilactobacillus siliginis]